MLPIAAVETTLVACGHSDPPPQCPQFAPGPPRPSAETGKNRRVRHELRVEVKPPWTFRLRGGSADGLTRRRNNGLQRLLHRDGKPVHVAVIQPAPDRVIFGARADSEPDAMWGIRRLRFATGVDDDLRPFYDAFKHDRYIGKAVRAAPEYRIKRAPMPWEALSNAICEQLIEFERAVAIQRRLIARLGTRCADTGLRDAASPARVAGDRAGAARLARPRAGARAHAARRRRRAGGRPRRPARRGPAARLAPAALDRGRRAVDARGARALRPGPPRPRPRRRPRLPQAGRPDHHRQPEGARRRGRGARVLRALRRVEGARRRVPAARRGARPAPAQSCDSRPGSSPSPGRNSFVTTCSALGRCLIRPWSSIQSA